jgi:hypothetical protein
MSFTAALFMRFGCRQCFTRHDEYCNSYLADQHDGFSGTGKSVHILSYIKELLVHSCAGFFFFSESGS